MAHMDLTNKNFDSIIGNGVTLVDFWADWCGPCKMQAPVIDELGEKYEGKVTVAKLNVDDEPSIAARFGVMSIPTLIVYREGEEVTRRVGVQSLDQLEVMLGDKFPQSPYNQYVTGKDGEQYIPRRIQRADVRCESVWAGGGSRSRAVPVNPSNRNRVLPLQRERVPHFHAEFRWYHVIITP